MNYKDNPKWKFCNEITGRVQRGKWRLDCTDLYSDYWTVEDFDGGKIDVFLCGRCNGSGTVGGNKDWLKHKNCPACEGDGLGSGHWRIG